MRWVRFKQGGSKMAQRSNHCAALGRTRPATRLLVLGLIALLLVATSVAVAAVPEIQVTATIETAPVPNIGDAADDPAIWIHPSDPSLSTIIGTDKSVGGGLGVYDLSGQQLYFYPDGRLNNVDVRYNFPLGGSRVSIVGATNRESTPRAMDFYKVDPATRSLTKIGSVATSSAITTPRGFSFYVSPVSGKYYAFVSDVGNIDQYELRGATGSVSGTLVRQFKLPNPTEGLVADDELGRIYVAEENIGGIWRYGGEPGDGSVGVKVDSTTETGGTIIQDVKGLALYYGANRTGYLIAISQGGNSFHLYDRVDNAKVGVFKVVAGAIDGVTGMDGIDVTNLNLGSAFPSGLFVTQDTTNEGGGNQNYKVVPWQSIANGFSPRLLVDNTWDPRLIGASGGAGDVTPPDTSIGSGPSGSVQTTTASFTFAATEQGATFECALDGGAFAGCSSPREYTGLGQGSHTFRVRAIDAARNADPSPASRTWSVDLTAPPVTSTTGPGNGGASAGGTAAGGSQPSGATGGSDPCAVQASATPPGCPRAGGADMAGGGATLSAKRVQQLGKTVVVVVGCKHRACVASASGVLNAATARLATVGKVTKSIVKGAKATLRLTLSKKARTAAARALGRRKNVTARITVIVRDSAGNPTRLTTTIKLKLRRT
jgi:myo-inositol-hexaphosphate 3-phosphohydrolase